MGLLSRQTACGAVLGDFDDDHLFSVARRPPDLDQGATGARAGTGRGADALSSPVVPVPLTGVVVPPLEWSQ